MRSDIQPAPLSAVITAPAPQSMHNCDDFWFSCYNFRRPLGHGGMGIVYLAEDKRNHDRPCVVKELSSKFNNPADHAQAIRLFKREAEILAGLDHPGIVRVLDAYVSSDNRYFLVMDYVPGTNLNLVLKTGGPLSQDLAVALTIQCLEVLEYLHGRNPPIIYRDLKPSNIMLTPEARVVLVDFGIARFLMPSEAATKVVSAGYSPPEQYAGKPEPASDLYALGCTLSHLLTNVTPKPFSVCSPLKHNPSILLELDALCRQLTAANPQERPASAREVRRTLYKIYMKANPSTEIPPDLLKDDQTPLRKPAQSKRDMDTPAQPPGQQGIKTTVHGFNTALHVMLHARAYFKRIGL